MGESQVKSNFYLSTGLWPVTKGVVNSRSVPMNGYKHSKQHMVTLTHKQICALTNTGYGSSSLVRLSISLRAKKINLDMLSSVLSSGSLYNLQ